MSNYKLDPGKSAMLAFIPSPLNILDRPELNIFPLNIMFVSYASIVSVDTSGSSLYFPDLETIQEDERQVSMRYYNQIAQIDYIDVWYFRDTGWYQGEKYVAGHQVSTSVGKNWRMFFIHLTAPGLSEGEQCDMKPMR